MNASQNEPVQMVKSLIVHILNRSRTRPPIKATDRKTEIPIKAALSGTEDGKTCQILLKI